jgi:hypothetical protein
VAGETGHDPFGCCVGCVARRLASADHARYSLHVVDQALDLAGRHAGCACQHLGRYHGSKCGDRFDFPAPEENPGPIPGGSLDPARVKAFD